MIFFITSTPHEEWLILLLLVLWLLLQMDVSWDWNWQTSKQQCPVVSNCNVGFKWYCSNFSVTLIRFEVSGQPSWSWHTILLDFVNHSLSGSWRLACGEIHRHSRLLWHCVVTELKEGKLISVFCCPIARAIAYSEPSCCSDGLQTGKTGNDVDERRTPTGLDYVRRTVLVEVWELILINVTLWGNTFFTYCSYSELS